jgi:hypothetical protein
MTTLCKHLNSSRAGGGLLARRGDDNQKVGWPDSFSVKTDQWPSGQFGGAARMRWLMIFYFMYRIRFSANLVFG